MVRESLLYGRPPAEHRARSSKYRQKCKAAAGNRSGLGTKRHPQSARGKQEQHERDMRLSQATMPDRKPIPELVANQSQAQDEASRAGDDMRIKRPLVRAKKIRLPTMQKFGREIRRKVIPIAEQNAERDFEKQCDAYDRQHASQGL